jgi:hypothetical protein
VKRPWQFWLAFLVCVAAMVTALGWLTVNALELDRAEAMSRRQAELERQVGRALWRMDVKLVPLLAQEAARPYFVYRPMYFPPVSSGKDTTKLTPSPLLTSRADFVLLNFQCTADNQWMSPQVPKGEAAEVARQQGVPAIELQRSSERLDALQSRVGYEHLVQRLPEEWLATDLLGQQKEQAYGQDQDQVDAVKKVIQTPVEVGRRPSQLDGAPRSQAAYRRVAEPMNRRGGITDAPEQQQQEREWAQPVARYATSGHSMALSDSR